MSVSLPTPAMGIDYLYLYTRKTTYKSNFYRIASNIRS